MDIRYWWYRNKYLNAKWMPLRRPVDLTLELSSYCNLRCAYCYHSDGRPPFIRNIMTKEMANHVLDQAADLGVNSLKFNFRGEATISTHFAAILSRAAALANKSTFIDRVLNTNMDFESEYKLKAMTTLTKLKVSCDSFRPDILKAQRRGCNPERIYSNIDKFYELRQKYNSKTKLVIQAVRTKANADEDLRGFVLNRWPTAEVSIRDMVSGRTADSNTRPLKFVEMPKKRQSCIQAHARLIVMANGLVSPCCPAFTGDLVIGDVRSESLKEIFNSYHAKALRKSLKDGSAFKSDPCKNCPSFESYAGYKAPRDS